MTIFEELKAIQDDNVEAVNEILARHEVARDSLNEAFIWSAKNGHLKVLKRLLMLLNPKNAPENVFIFFLQSIKRLIARVIPEKKSELNDVLNKAFQEATTNGHLEVVKYLLTLDNPKVDYTAEDDYAFQMAVENGHLEVVKLLLTLDNPEVGYVAKDKAFNWAAQKGQLEVIKLLSMPDNPWGLSMPDKPWFSNDYAFQTAVENGHLEVVKYLLRLDNPEVGYVAKYKAFNWAAQKGQLEVVKYLLTRDKSEVDCRSANDSFRLAAEQGHLGVVKHLLTLEDPKVDYRADNDVAFRLAAQHGQLEVVNHLLTLPNIDPSTNNFEAVTWALGGEYCPVAEAITRWVRTNGTDAQRKHLGVILDRQFGWAASTGHLEVVKLLLITRDNPQVDYRADNDVAFRLAAENGHLEVVKLLLTLDPPVNYSAMNHMAFRYAAGNGRLEVVKHLLTLENPNVDYRIGNDYAFRYAAQNGHLNVINHLLTLPNIDPSVNNFQAVVWALERRHLPVVETIARWVRAHGTTTQRNRLDEILGNHGVVINYEQSTHAASVHKSVSESATRLMARYGDDIKGNKLHTVLESMTTYVNTLPSSTVVTDPTSAGQRYLAGVPIGASSAFTGNIISPEADSRFLFKDPGSGITTQQVLALTYLAALDEKAHPLTSTKDTLEHFVRGLYEARRGYNLNDKNKDNGLADNMICTPGAFNKAIEALATIHPDCEIVLVTKVQASMKMPKVAEAEAYAYLHHQLQQAQSPQQLDDFKVLLAKVKDDGISVILPDISNNVAKVMFEEFGSLYSDDMQDANFQALIATAEYVGLDESKLDALVAETLKRLNDVETSGLPEASLNTFTPGYSQENDARVAEDNLNNPELDGSERNSPRI